MSEESSVGSAWPKNQRGIVTWNGEQNIFDLNPLPIWEVSFVKYLEQVMKASGADRIHIAVRKMLMLDLTLRVSYDLDLPFPTQRLGLQRRYGTFMFQRWSDLSNSPC